jgi:hypothetical protein
MKAKVLFALFSLAAAWAGPSSATSFTGAFSVDYNTTDPGLVIEVDPVSGSNFSFDLANAGDATGWIPLFNVSTPECCANLDDFLNPHIITTTFDFISPDISGLVAGVTGSLFLFNYVLWDGPVSVLFGNGGLLNIFLSDGLFGFAGGSAATVSAKFQLVSAPLPVPLPPAAILLGTALIGTGVLSWRKRGRKGGAKGSALVGTA